MKLVDKRLLIFLIILFVMTLVLTGCFQFAPGKTENIQKDKGKTTIIDNFNIGKELENIAKKTINPPVITSHKSYEEFTSETDKKLIIISGESEPGTKIEIKANGRLLSNTYQADSQGRFEIKDGIELIEGQNAISIYAVNPSGNKSEPTKLVFILNVIKTLDFKIFEDPQNLKEIDQYYYTSAFEPVVFISGKGIPETEIYLKINEKIVATKKSDSGGYFSFTEAHLERGENIITLWSLSKKQEPGAPVTKKLIAINDQVSPRPVSLSGYITKDGNFLTWEKSTDESFLSYKIVRVDEPCLNPQYPADDVIDTITDSSITSYTDKNVISGKAYFYTLWIIDKAGNLSSSNILALPAPKYQISLEKMNELQGDKISRRQWYTQYFEITNTGNVPVNIQPVFDFIILEPESVEEMALNPLWSVYIWQPDTGVNYYSNEDIKATKIADWINVRGTRTVNESESYNDDKTIKTRVITTTIRQTQEKDGKRLVTVTVITRTIQINTATGAIISDTSSSVSTESIAEPEKAGTVIQGIEPGQKIKVAVKIVNVAADNGDKITVHFHFAPADCQGYFFTEDMVSTGDIQITSTGK